MADLAAEDHRHIEVHARSAQRGRVAFGDEIWLDSGAGIDVPTREEMREIETSNRLYEEGDALYMTATVVTKLDTDRPTSDQITFILTPDRLITNRYVDPLPFRRYVAYAEKHAAQCNTAPAILAGISVLIR